MPPSLQGRVKPGGVKSRYKGLGVIALTDNFHAVGRRSPGCHVRYETLTNSSPTGLFAPPLNATTGPGQLFAVEEATTGTDDSIG